jgi:LmbE family N-acetylglucosaminyl deacetylase
MRLRRLVSRSVRSALRARSRPFQCRLFRSIAVVSPHPDDETLGCAGTLALLVQAGAEAHVIFVTDGSASHPSHPRLTADQIAETRKAEALTAAGKLGLNGGRVHFVGGPDGKLAGLDDASTGAIASKIAGILQAAAPELVFLPLRRDGSTDHNATFGLVQLALQKAVMRPRIFEFPIWAWRNPLLQLGPMLTSTAVWRTDIEGVLSQKEAAIDSYVSQICPIPPDTLSVLSEEFTSEFRFTEEFFFER